MKARLRIALATILLVLGAWQVSQAGWIHAKAIVAQQLIASAWVQGRDAGAAPRPWPGAADLAMAELRLDRLPSAAALQRLLAAARSCYGVPPGLAVAAAPGSEVVIRALPRLLGGPVLLAATSYGSYAEAWQDAGAARPWRYARFQPRRFRGA